MRGSPRTGPSRGRPPWLRGRPGDRVVDDLHRRDPERVGGEGDPGDPPQGEAGPQQGQARQRVAERERERDRQRHGRAVGEPGGGPDRDADTSPIAQPVRQWRVAPTASAVERRALGGQLVVIVVVVARWRASVGGDTPWGMDDSRISSAGERAGSAARRRRRGRDLVQAAIGFGFAFFVAPAAFAAFPPEQAVTLVLLLGVAINCLVLFGERRGLEVARRAVAILLAPRFRGWCSAPGS